MADRGGEECIRGVKQKLCGYNDCPPCVGRSLAAVQGQLKCTFLSATDVKGLKITDAFKVAAKSHIRAEWRCHACNHTFTAITDNVVKRRSTASGGCKYCAKQSLCNDPTCEMCHANSFASSSYASRFVSSSNGLLPRQIASSSNAVEVTIQCNVCPHTFTKSPNRIYRIERKGERACSYCSKSELCETGDCSWCFKGSIMASPRASCILRAVDGGPLCAVFRSSGRELVCKCDVCWKTFEMSANCIDHGRWCPCCGKRQLCENIHCEKCLAKTVAGDPALMAIWSKENTCNPRRVFKSADRKVQWKCLDCKQCWNAVLDRVARGTRCPHCKHKTQTMVFAFLQSLYPDAVREWSCGLDRKRMDVYLPSLKIVIEIDGRQHFEDVSHFQTSPDETMSNDIEKMRAVLPRGISVIRIRQDTVWNAATTAEWQPWLRAAIARCSTSTTPMILLGTHDDFDGIFVVLRGTTPYKVVRFHI